LARKSCFLGGVSGFSFNSGVGEDLSWRGVKTDAKGPVLGLCFSNFPFSVGEVCRSSVDASVSEVALLGFSSIDFVLSRDSKGGVAVLDLVGPGVSLFFTIPELNPSGNPPMVKGFIEPPIGGERSSPPVVTSLNELVLTGSTLPFSCFDLFSSVIQLGCCEGGAFGLGESVGLLIALSSQLDLVGLHRFGSIVFEGLTGRSSSFSGDLGLFASGVRLDLEIFKGSGGLTKPSFVVDSARPLMVPEVPSRSFSFRFATTVALL
jgi:hypothetical protein